MLGIKVFTVYGSDGVGFTRMGVFGEVVFGNEGWFLGGVILGLLGLAIEGLGVLRV